MQVLRTHPGDMHEQRAWNALDLMVAVQQGALQRQYYQLQVHLVLSRQNLDAQGGLGVDLLRPSAEQVPETWSVKFACLVVA